MVPHRPPDSVNHLLRALCTGLAAFPCLAAPAEAQLSISPNVVEGKAYPGGIWTFTLGVMNVGDEPLACTTAIQSMEVLDSGMPIPVEEAPRSCKEWITSLNQEFTLEPKAGKRVVFRAQPPREVVGGYYALISVDGRPGEASVEQQPRAGVSASVKFGHRGLVPVLLTIPGANLEAVIDAAKPLISLREDDRGYVLQLPVRNRGNIHARLTGSLEVRSHAGQLVDRCELGAGRGFVLPDHERLLESRSTLKLPDGAYVVQVQLDVERGKRPMRNAFPFAVQSGIPSVQEITPELLAELEKQSAGFIVRPGQLSVALRPGARRAQAIEVTNLTEEPLRLRPTTREWTRLPDGRDLVLESDPAHGRSCRGLVDLGEEVVEIRPLSRRRVPVTVALPSSEVGESYCAILLDREDLQLDESPRGRARRSVMLRVIAEGTAEPKAEIAGLEVVREPNGAVVFTVDVRNTGNQGLVPDVTFHLRDGGGDVVARTRPAVQPALVQAGGEALIDAVYDKVLDPGTYAADVTLRFDPNRPVITARATIEIPSPAEARPVSGDEERDGDEPHDER